MPPPIKLNLRPILATLVLALIWAGSIPVKSSGDALIDGTGGFSSQVTSDDTPLLLSQNVNNRMLRLWAPPSSTVVILYDQWNFYLFGSPNQTWKVVVNEVLVLNGTLSGSWMNTTWSAGSVDRARVNVTVGGKTWTWWNVIINHQEIGYSGPGAQVPVNPYDEHDLNWAKLKTAIGVILTAFLVMPIVWFGVKTYRDRQGVRRW